LANLNHVTAALAKRQRCIAVRAFAHWLAVVSHPKHFIAHLSSPLLSRSFRHPLPHVNKTPAVFVTPTSPAYRRLTLRAQRVLVNLL
jgi:hypothetical protein